MISSKYIKSTDADGILAKIISPEIPGNTIHGPFGRQRRSRGFWIPVSVPVMGPLVSTKISQPAPQTRCIGFGPGEPCSQAFGIGGTETAVGHSTALSVRDQSSRPSPTTAIFEQRSTYGDRLGFARRSGFNAVRHSKPWLAGEASPPLPF